MLGSYAGFYETVPHKKLLHKLTAYGINGPIHAWLTQFLTARTMQVVLEGQTTNQVTVDSGVPQGTVLGPLLFLCHINDFPDCVKSQTPLWMIVCSTVKLKPNKITFSIRGKSKHCSNVSSWFSACQVFLRRYGWYHPLDDLVEVC
jgi:hypothetical protein